MSCLAHSEVIRNCRMQIHIIWYWQHKETSYLLSLVSKTQELPCTYSLNRVLCHLTYQLVTQLFCSLTKQRLGIAFEYQKTNRAKQRYREFLPKYHVRIISTLLPCKILWFHNLTSRESYLQKNRLESYMTANMESSAILNH